jgi:hypothetical protein
MACPHQGPSVSFSSSSDLYLLIVGYPHCLEVLKLHDLSHYRPGQEKADVKDDESDPGESLKVGESVKW